MTLLELMVKEGMEWPEGATHAYQMECGDVTFIWVADGFVAKKDDLSHAIFPAWLRVGHYTLVSDWRDSIVTHEQYEQATQPQGHPHAELMAQYAEIAKTNPKPWLEFEYNDLGDWMPMEKSGYEWFLLNNQYRRKPRTININGFDVTEPMREKPKSGEVVYFVRLSSDSGLKAESSLSLQQHWCESNNQLHWFNWGLCHATKESAELHAKALLSFTKQ